MGLIYIALGYGLVALTGTALLTGPMLAMEMAMGLAVGALVGILLNAVLPGNDYVFGTNEQGDESVNFKV